MLILGILFGYLIGAIPTAYIFGKMLKGIDIRQHGSGNVGATNVFRVLGKGPGFVVLFLDILKGFIVVAVLADFFGLTSILDRIILSAAAVCGHNWTVFLNFKGGKGIATSLGVLIALAVKVPSVPLVLLTVVAVWLVFFLVFGYVSLASIFAAVSFPLASIYTSQELPFLVLSFVLSIFVVYRHKSNIQRLINGKEPKVPFWIHKKKA